MLINIEQYQDCLQSLKIPEAGARYQQVVKSHDRTFGWLFEKNTVQFIDWLREPKETGPAGRLLWVTGKPGSGKSTIMKHAIGNPKTMDYLKASDVREWHMIPFFFSDRGSEKQRAFKTMLQEILYQLLGRIRDSFDLLLPLYTRLCEDHETKIPKWDTGTLCEGITEVITRSISKAGICLFMDALDEHSGDNENLCQFFWDLSSKSGVSISLKICLASRPWPVFQKHFRGCKGFAIHEHTENDICGYVTSRLYEASESIDSRDLATQDEMQEKAAIYQLAEDVTRNAQGVFIWVRLVIDELCQGLTDGTPIAILSQTLNSIPHELEDLYERALSKVRQSYAAEAHIMLHMVLSSLSPLPTQTLLGCVTWLLGHIVDPQKPEEQANRLASRAGGLLEVVNIGGSSIVQFIHQTAKDYIRHHGSRLSLSYMDRAFEQNSEAFLMSKPSSPLESITRWEFRDMKGLEFLFLCGVQEPSISASIAPHLFTYAKQVDNIFPQLDHNRGHLALDTFRILLHNKSLWQSSPAYTSLKSFTAGPSQLELAVAANWTNTIEQYQFEVEFTKAAHLAAVGPTIIDDCIDRIGMVKALIRLAGQTSHDRFEQSKTFPSPEGGAIQLSDILGESTRKRMLESVDAVAHDIVGEVPLLTTLVSIKSHPLVSESQRIEIAIVLLEANVGSLIGPETKLALPFICGVIQFRSLLSFCFHFGSVTWVNSFLEKAPRLNTNFGTDPSLARCLASNRDLISPLLRAAFLQDFFGKTENKLRPNIRDIYLKLVGVRRDVAWCGVVGGFVCFEHMNHRFCGTTDHPMLDVID